MNCLLATISGRCPGWRAVRTAIRLRASTADGTALKSRARTGGQCSALERGKRTSRPATENRRAARGIDRAIGSAGREEVGARWLELSSLQELCAAKSLIRASDEQVLDQLDAILCSARWRYTWLLAPGGFFAARQRQRGDRISRVRAAGDGYLISLAAPGAPGE